MADRPPRRDALVQTRVTAAEREAFEREAAATDRSVSEWVRDVLRLAAGLRNPEEGRDER